MLLVVSCSTITYVQRQKAKRPANYSAPATKTMPILCFSFPAWWGRLREKPAKQFTVSYKRANSVDPYDHVNIRPVAPPQPIRTYIPEQIEGYTLPNIPHPSHLIHPTSSLNRLRSEIAIKVNPAIKYFTLQSDNASNPEEFPSTPITNPTHAANEDAFYNTPSRIND